MNHTIKKRAVKMNNELKKLFPKAGIMLRYSNSWELLVSVILSAQCTDVTVNKITEKLFKKYKTLDDYILCDHKEFEKDIYSTGFYRNKTKHISASAKKIKKEFFGKVPSSMKELLSLPGVARKTANVVLGNAYGIIEGIAVDTHVRRISYKFGLTKYKDPNKIEGDLMKLLPQKEWFGFTYRVIEFGRKFCPARRHNCILHPLTKIYPKAASRWIT